MHSATRAKSVAPPDGKDRLHHPTPVRVHRPIQIRGLIRGPILIPNPIPNPIPALAGAADMTRPRSVIAACLLSASALAAGSAQAQSSFYVDRLISGSAEIVPLRGIDTSVRASKRYAIVIGNSDYAAIPDLPNAHADAGAMAQFFDEQGYLVHYHEDVTKRDFEDILRRVLFDVDSDTEVVLFFAGHGFQIGADNYLVPVDADLDTIYDVPFEAVSLGSVVGIVGARARLQVVILDSCRDNPFAGKEVLAQVGNTLRETRTGFSSQAAPLNSMLIFSTSPGALAYDGEGDNSPFTASLLEEATDKPGDLVKDVFERVRRLTFERTNGRQVPWDSSTLIEPATFGRGIELIRPINVNSTGTGVTRGLARVSPDQPEGLEQIVPAAVLSGTLEIDFVPEVAIGPAIAETLDLAPDASVVFTARPETGILMFPSPVTGILEDVTGDTLTPDQVFDLVLVNESVQIPALSMSSQAILDVVPLSVDGEEQQIAFNLIPSDCDFHAGDHLDPDGMGIVRYPNEIQPEVALAACQAAVDAEPENGRYHYQLGRALQALRRDDDAKASYEVARDLGHTRAWYALGWLAVQEERRTNGRVPWTEGTKQILARGVAEGDPYAFHTLGFELLRNGGTTEIEVEGYDLLVRAMEVGHTFSMNALTGLYLDEGSEYYDPERALRYMRESVARNDIYGQMNLGRAYQEGQAGLDVDLGQAFDLMSKAADGGHPQAPFWLGLMYRDGEAPGGTDNARAVELMQVSLERGYAQAAANAAYLIRNQNVPGYDRFDAAAIAGKGAALVGSRGHDKALEQAEAMASSDLDGGTQRIMVELGAEIGVDGAFGPGSQQALDALLAQHGAGPAETDPLQRLLQVAALSWKLSPFRTDLL